MNWFVRLSVWHNFLKGREISLLCFYWSTNLIVHMQGCQEDEFLMDLLNQLFLVITGMYIHIIVPSYTCTLVSLYTLTPEVGSYKRKQESKKTTNTLSTKKAIKKNRGKKIFFIFLVVNVFSFFFSWPLSFFLVRFLGQERVFFLFFLIAFLVESVFSCFLL